MGRGLLALLALGAAAACATTDPYHPSVRAGAPGYAEARLGDQEYQVTYQADARTDREAAEAFAVLRAAELTRAEGQEWFLITSADIDEPERNVDEDIQKSTAGSNFWITQCTSTDPTSSMCSQLQAPSVNQARAPADAPDGVRVTLTVFMGSGESPDPDATYHADAILAAHQADS